MKAKEVFIINLSEDPLNPDYIVAFKTEKSVKDLPAGAPGFFQLSYAGRFTVRAYALRFAQLLREGAA